MDDKNVFIERTFQYVHSAVFIGPVHDILNGKVILVNTDSQYGILINYLPALIFKLVSPFMSLSFTSFFYLMIVYGIIYYIIAFILLKYRFHSPLWALIGLVTLFSLHFYLSLDRYIRPMVFPIRYLLDMPFFLILFSYSKGKTIKKSLVISIYLALAILYNYETGISLSVAFVFYEFLESCRYSPNLKTALKKSVITIIVLLSALLLTGSGYSIYAKYITGSFPDWSRALFYIRIFGLGFIASNSSLIGFYLFPLAIYLIFLTKILYSLFQKIYSDNFSWNGALTAYGLLIYIYYIERSYVLNVPVLSIPAIILGIILFKELYSKYRLFCPYLALGSFIVFSFIFYAYRFTNNYKFEYWKGDLSQSEAIYNKINDSAKTINYYQPSDKAVAVLSYVDTLLLLKAGKTNSLPYSATQNIFTASQVDNILKNIKTASPRYLFADFDPWLEINIYPSVFEYIHDNYRLVESIGIINVWEKNI